MVYCIFYIRPKGGQTHQPIQINKENIENKDAITHTNIIYIYVFPQTQGGRVTVNLSLVIN